MSRSRFSKSRKVRATVTKPLDFKRVLDVWVKRYKARYRRTLMARIRRGEITSPDGVMDE